MSKLILVKHSLPEIVPALPANRWELSTEGCRRSLLLAQRLADYQPDFVISSLEPKAFQTARFVAAWLGLELELCAGLHEHERTSAAFASQEQFQTSVAAFFAHPDQLVFGEESARQALRRFDRALTGLLLRRPRGNLVVVAHGTVITLFVTQVCGGEPFELWKRLDLPSFIVLERPVLKPGVMCRPYSIVESIL